MDTVGDSPFTRVNSACLHLKGQLLKGRILKGEILAPRQMQQILYQPKYRFEFDDFKIPWYRRMDDIDLPGASTNGNAVSGTFEPDTNDFDLNVGVFVSR